MIEQGVICAFMVQWFLVGFVLGYNVGKKKRMPPRDAHGRWKKVHERPDTCDRGDDGVNL